jgi:hypothetical protein
MDSGDEMKPSPISHPAEHSRAAAWSDWFDDAYDSVLILEIREYEENGFSPRVEIRG